MDSGSVCSVDPDSDSESRSGSRRAKMTHKVRKKVKKFHVLRAEVFYGSLDVLYGGLRISQLNF